MSAIALAWVAKTKVGHSTAKQLLLFYASHNFSKPGFEFKNQTLADQLEVSERSIQEAHKLLQEKNLIKRIAQYDKTGRQCSTLTYLNIPNTFVDGFFGSSNNDQTDPPANSAPPSRQPVDNFSKQGGGGCATFTHQGAPAAPLDNNNKINNKNNNNIYINNNKNMYKKETDVNKQGIIKSTRSKELLEFKDKSTPDQAKKFFETLPPHLRPKRYVQLEPNVSLEKSENQAADGTIKLNVSQSQAQGSTISGHLIHT